MLNIDIKMFKLCVSYDYLSVLIILFVGVCSSLAIQDRERLHYNSITDDNLSNLDEANTVIELTRHHTLLRREIRQEDHEPEVLEEVDEDYVARYDERGHNMVRRQLGAQPRDNNNGQVTPETTRQTGVTNPPPPNTKMSNEQNRQPSAAPPSTHLHSVDNRSGGEADSSADNTSGGGGGASSTETSSGGGASVAVRDNHQPPARPQSGDHDTRLPEGNVGTNGTGIRWTNVTVVGGAAQHPLPVVSEPINPQLLLNDTNNNNNMDFPEDITNDTLKQHNVTRKEDHHDYYNSTITVDQKLGEYYWNDIASQERLSAAQVSELLSSSHRRAVTVQLTFDFPFYGHPVRNVTVATGGFLYTGDYVHSWLAATQYIAPLMANFDTSLSNTSFVKFYDNGTAFTVLWENVSLQDRPHDGTFTFSATLLSSGDIVFVYKQIPVLVENIEDNKHPVKVGLSDAYIIDRTVFFTRRKTIYEYHRVQFKQEDIKNWTVVYLTALPTCVLHTDCRSCMAQTTGFTCAWCPYTNRCSSGLDRYRQEWLSKGCNLTQVPTIDQCPAPGTRGNNASTTTNSPMYDDIPNRHPTTTTSPSSADTGGHRAAHHTADDTSRHVVSDGGDPMSSTTTQTGGGSNSAGVVAVLVPLCLITVLAGWLLYAYRNPHTKSGQMLIRYRPSQWTWRRGEARYTAATIHM